MSCNKEHESIENKINEYRKKNNILKDEKIKPL